LSESEGNGVPALDWKPWGDSIKADDHRGYTYHIWALELDREIKHT
jgi:hypothetical protein